MIQNKIEACQILGISTNAGQAEWKSAFRDICKKYHPDSITGCSTNQACEYYFQAKEAYEYLETHAVKVVQSGTRIIGGPITYHNHQENRKKVKEQMERSKKERYQEMQAAAEKLKKEEEEKRILDEIRWIRVAEIIRKTIEKDRIEKEQIKSAIDTMQKRKED